MRLGAAIARHCTTLHSKVRRTLCLFAQILGYTECLALLLHHGAYLSFLDSLNEVPLHKCAANDHPDCLALLLEAHARQGDRKALNQPNVLGSTPLHRVSSREIGPKRECAWIEDKQFEF